MNERFARWLAVRFGEYPHAQVGASGSTLLHDALRSSGRSTLFLPAFVCCELSLMAVAAGMRVVHVSVDPKTMLIDHAALVRQLHGESPEDVAVLVDHAFGYPVPWLAELKRDFPSLLLIEDCVRALGGHVGQEPVGHQGDLVLLSLHKTTQGNDHGAVLLSRERSVAAQPDGTATVSAAARLSRISIVRRLYGLLKRRSPSYPHTDHRIDRKPVWMADRRLPSPLVYDRFLRVQATHAQLAERSYTARTALAEQLGRLDWISVVASAAGTVPADYFLSFTVRAGIERDKMLGALHRKGHSLLRTWDQVPPFLLMLSATFPEPPDSSVFLADHVVHVPLHAYLGPSRRSALMGALEAYARDTRPSGG